MTIRETVDEGAPLNLSVQVLPLYYGLSTGRSGPGSTSV